MRQPYTCSTMAPGPSFLLAGASRRPGRDIAPSGARITETRPRDALGGRTVALLDVVAPEGGREGA